MEQTHNQCTSSDYNIHVGNIQPDVKDTRPLTPLTILPRDACFKARFFFQACLMLTRSTSLRFLSMLNVYYMHGLRWRKFSDARLGRFFSVNSLTPDHMMTNTAAALTLNPLLCTVHPGTALYTPVQI
jgi:hypothetical protein